MIRGSGEPSTTKYMTGLTPEQMEDLYMGSHPYLLELLAECNDPDTARDKFKATFHELKSFFPNLPASADYLAFATGEHYIELLTTPERVRDYISSCAKYTWGFQERFRETVPGTKPSSAKFCNILPFSALDPVLVRGLASQDMYSVLQFAIRDDFPSWPANLKEAFEQGASVCEAVDLRWNQTDRVVDDVSEGLLDLGSPGLQRILEHVKHTEENDHWVLQYRDRYDKFKGLALFFKGNRKPLSLGALLYLANNPDFTPGALIGLCQSDQQPELPVEFWNALFNTWAKRKGAEYGREAMTWWPGYDQYPEIRTLVDNHWRSMTTRHTLVSEATGEQLWEIAEKPFSWGIAGERETAVKHKITSADWNKARGYQAAKRLITEGLINNDQELARFIASAGQHTTLVPLWSSHPALGSSSKAQVLILAEKHSFSAKGLEGTIILEWLLSDLPVQTARNFIQNLSPSARAQADEQLTARQKEGRKARAREKAASQKVPRKA